MENRSKKLNFLRVRKVFSICSQQSLSQITNGHELFIMRPAFKSNSEDAFLVCFNNMILIVPCSTSILIFLITQRINVFHFVNSFPKFAFWETNFLKLKEKYLLQSLINCYHATIENVFWTWKQVCNGQLRQIQNVCNV